ncbi:MAG: acetyl-CoA hydrolase/transferase C-terminal domain-containing protein [Syntrophomonadaceae bacterium]|nr:acetyl-CoA hydrolase/transferase C-terminal domain-containing protein [Syntrophomonadaceae bacterium]
MNVKEMYKAKLKHPMEAVGLVQSGDRVLTPLSNGIPIALMKALTARTDLEDVSLYSGIELFPLETYGPKSNPGLKIHSIFLGPAVRPGVQHGWITHTPGRLAEAPEIVRRHLPMDVVMMVVSPMDEHGFFSSGTNADYAYTVAKMPRTRNVIVQVSENMPRTWGDNHLHISEVSAVVEFTQPLVELPEIPMTKEDETIGGLVAEMIEDGSTLQLGIGGIPNAVGHFLGSRKDLGIHTEMFSDAMLELYLQGAVTGRCKTLKPGKWIGCFILGTNKLYKFVHDNPMTEIHSSEWVNDPAVIGLNEKMVSINTAVEADLTGQVNAETIGRIPYSGTGGFVDFIEGCWRSKGGKSFIALYSTYTDKEGQQKSRIVSTLFPGSAVTGIRSQVQYIVTEYGVALMKGMSLRQRARNLIAIAHPDFRDQLTFEAKQLRILD